jgi:hypothetical protein
MGWTTPRTWTDGELVTKVIMDQHVRDNFNSTTHVHLRKTADQSVTSSVVVVNATDLGLTVAANEVWLCDWSLIYTGPTAGDLRIAFTFPTAGEFAQYAVYPDGAGTLQSGAFFTGTSPTAELIFAVSQATVRNALSIKGHFVNGGNAGTVQLQFAQGTSNATATTLKQNSVLMACKIA